MSHARRFLFLQGPHGPFFNRLAGMLMAAGNEVWRVGFNAGDRAFWWRRSRYIPFTGPLDHWPDRFSQIVERHGITDVVLYGDTRPVHAEAIAQARELGLTIHVFEEGYLRPYWATYERNGSNGNSPLMTMSVDDMARTLSARETEPVEAPTHWGDMRQHAIYSFLYHLCILIGNRRYRRLRSHRALPVYREFLVYLRRVLFQPLVLLDRTVVTSRIISSGHPFHIVLMQLEHDSAFQTHSPFKSMEAFLSMVVAGFAQGAAKHHHLVFKAHPMESGRLPMRRLLRDLAEAHGVKGRVHYVPGGKLARILNAARSAVTVNSTAAQQVLWRGMPLKSFGAAVYNKPEFVSDQALSAFFNAPQGPNAAAYQAYRRYLLETSQVPGGFYSARGRRQLLRRVVDLMLAPRDPYQALAAPGGAPEQQLRLIKR
ncbi:MAG: capsule biosynthesis protein CapA [Pseudomonadota bacterium]